jgi:transcriptional regulator with PAS, ATPase and Fis domain
MQIIAFGLHKHNISSDVWNRAESDHSHFYDFIDSLNIEETTAEFLFVNSQFSKEIISVTEQPDKFNDNFRTYFRKSFPKAKQNEPVYHILEGSDAVKHFLQLSLGVESFFPDNQKEFLTQTKKSIEIANQKHIAGPVTNRLYHDVLLLQGKLQNIETQFDYSHISNQIQTLIRKIFGKVGDLNFLVIGKNAQTDKIIQTLQDKNNLGIKLFSKEIFTEREKLLYDIINEKQLEQILNYHHVIFRLNQDVYQFFRPDYLRTLMHRRKNQPLLIVNLDSTIKSDSSLDRIYNLYIFSLSDFQKHGNNGDEKLDIQNVIDKELKEFFDWFYSKELYRFGDIIARSDGMEQVLEMVARISQTNITVLIQGESGTGKEIIARAIHKNSPRRDKPFIVVNCSALPDTLLESELFGHEKGAFTGATYMKKGLFQEADQGTIFLDEIGDTTPALQVKLLRVLQEGEIKRVGSNDTILIDVRLIAATNQNLIEMVKQNKFRQDLYYRLNVVNVDIPPLQNRKDDILPLAEYFKGKYADKMKKQITTFSVQARQTMLMYSWPGNVRELENAIERAVALTIGNTIHTSELPLSVRDDVIPGVVRENVEKGFTLKEIEKNVIENTLISNNWNYDKVTEILDIGRTTLWRKMKEYGIQKK